MSDWTRPFSPEPSDTARPQPAPLRHGWTAGHRPAHPSAASSCLRLMPGPDLEAALEAIGAA